MHAVVDTERLILRPWTLDAADVDRVHDTYSRWEVARWLGAQPRALASRDEAVRAIRRWQDRSTPDGRGGVWAAQVRATGVVAGSILLVSLPEPATGEVEVGWHLHPDSWGQGYATEGARAAIEYGFDGGQREIYAVVRPDNAPSLAVCRRLGMTPLGRTTRWYGTELAWQLVERVEEIEGQLIIRFAGYRFGFVPTAGLTREQIAEIKAAVAGARTGQETMTG